MAKVNVDVKIVSAETVRAAAMNASGLKDVRIEITPVSSKDLSIDDKIFGIILNPVHDDESKSKDPILYAAVNAIEVEVLNGKVKPGFIVVNGTIELPKEPGRMLSLEQAFFATREEAAMVCQASNEVELSRAEERKTREERAIAFLAKQIADERF